MGCPVKDFLKLVLGVPLGLSPIRVYKSLGVTQVPAEERLELGPCDWERSVCVMFLLVLLPAEADPVPEEGRGKKNLDMPLSSGGSKVVLTLLTKVVAVHVRLLAVYVWGTGLQLLAGCLGDNRSRSGSGSGNESENGNRSGDLSL